MRLLMAPLVLAAALPAFSQGVERYWYFDLHQVSPTLEGHFRDAKADNPVDVDLTRDLGLRKDKAKLGFSLEYQGPRFGLELSRDGEDYVGSNTVAQKVTINNTTFTADTLVNSRVKATNNTLNWTIRILRWPQAWIGLDLGARATQLEISANGSEPFSGVTATADYKATLPVPQVGLSAGFQAFNNRLIGRGYYHFLSFKGATYRHPGADLRFFPINWLGVRVFTDGEHFKVPKGSVNDTADIALDRTGTGVGIVARW